MRRVIAVLGACCLFVIVRPACAQQIDVAFGGGSTSAPGSTFSSANFAPSLSGGNYAGFSGDVLIKRNFGVQGEVAWRTSQASYGGQLPYRPIFWDFNGIYARRFTKFVGAEALAGIGAESVRFYEGAYNNCDIYGNCTNYVSSTHFMGDFGGGIRLYPYGNFFVRPEMRLYLINNNVEFSSGHAVRYGVSIGYTFGGSK